MVATHVSSLTSEDPGQWGKKSGALSLTTTGRRSTLTGGVVLTGGLQCQRLADQEHGPAE